MPDVKARLAVNGYGVIGKRVADVVTLQDDMELIGVADVASNFRVRVAVERGHAVFASDSAAGDQMAVARIPMAGMLDDLLGRIDVVAHYAPKKLAAASKDRYQAASVKGMWQGGEKHELTGYSSCAQVNDAGGLDRDWARVVSCNTIALSHTMHARFAGVGFKASEELTDAPDPQREVRP